MLHIFTVASFKALQALTLVLVGLGVGACPSVLTGLMGATVVQIFITEQSSPVDVAHALPGLSAAPIHAPRKREALVTERAHPAVVTLAFAGFVTETVDLVTPLFTHSFFALRPSPALHADLGAVGVTFEVSDEVVASSAELVAEGAVVVGVTAEAQAVLEAEGAPVVPVDLPLLPRVQHGRQQDPLDQLTRFC